MFQNAILMPDKGQRNTAALNLRIIMPPSERGKRHIAINFSVCVSILAFSCFRMITHEPLKLELSYLHANAANQGLRRDWISVTYIHFVFIFLDDNS